MIIGRNHVIRQMLYDKEFALDCTVHYHPELKKFIDDGREDVDNLSHAILSTYQNMSPTGSKTYYITNTVMDKLDLLKVKKNKANDKGILHYDWSLPLCKVPDGKYNFVFPTNDCLRIIADDRTVQFIWFTLEVIDDKKNQGMLNWHMFYVEKDKEYLPCEHFDSEEVQKLQDTVYKLCCFVYLSDIEEVIMQPGEKKGTKKSGKIINELNMPVTVINSRWNVTTINNDSFEVSGYFALRHVGVGRTEQRIVWVDPYVKNGYVRKARGGNI